MVTGGSAMNPETILPHSGRRLVGTLALHCLFRRLVGTLALHCLLRRLVGTLALQIMLIMLIMSKKRIPPFHQKRMICAHPLSPTDYISSPFALESWTLSVTIDTGVLKPEIKRPLCLGGFV